VEGWLGGTLLVLSILEFESNNRHQVEKAGFYNIGTPLLLLQQATTTSCELDL